MKVRDGEKYDLMPSLDGMILVDEFEDPKAGQARITLTDTNTGGKLSYAFTEGRKDWWFKRGVPPVVWQYVPPTRERAPQLLIAVDRLTTIEEVKPTQKFPTFWVPEPSSKRPPTFPSVDMGKGGGGCSCHTGHHVSTPRFDGPVVLSRYEGYDPVYLEPKVTIFRAQNPSLMPSPLDPSTIPASIGAPHIILPGDKAAEVDTGAYDSNGELDFKKLTEHKDHSEIATGVLVQPQPQGVVFQALNNWFYITVELKDKNRPGAFAYHVLTTGATKVLLIEHDRNVKVEVTTVEAPSTKPIIVYARPRWDASSVPVQGAKIKFDKDSFKKVDVPDTSKTSLILATQTVVETLMGFVPVIGDLYQLGQVGFMCATGRDFWGHKVSSAEIALYGVMSLVAAGAPILMNRAAKRAALRAIEGADSIAGAMQAPGGMAATALREADEVAIEVGGNRTARELSVLSQAEREKILEPVLKAADAGGDAVKSTEQAAKVLNDGIAAAVKADKEVAAAIDDIRAAALLTEDGQSFQNQYLRFEYDIYRTGKGSAAKGPLEWLSQGSRNPWVDKYCHTVFGKDYKAAIRGTLKRARVPGTMTAKHIELYDELIRKGIGSYGQMGRLAKAKKIEGFGQFFELDHIVEQRFLKHFPDYREAYAKGEAFGTFLVPKNSAVAAEMIRVAPKSNEIRYVHVVKTRMLSQRIPFGAEGLYNVQQIADATLYTLQKLGAREYMDIAYLEADFKLLAMAMGQSTPRLRAAAELTEDLFTAAKGWPQVKCDNWGRAIF